MSALNYAVVQTFGTRKTAESFCERFGVNYLDVIFNHGGEGLEARAYEDYALQGITEEQRTALIKHSSRHIK